MKTLRPLRTVLPSLAAWSCVASSAMAHPGHDHGDIPSVLRHPFAGLEHVAIATAVGVAVAGVLALVWKIRRGANDDHAAHPRTARQRDR